MITHLTTSVLKNYFGVQISVTIEEIEPKIKCHKQYISSKLAKPHEELLALNM